MREGVSGDGIFGVEFDRRGTTHNPTEREGKGEGRKQINK